MHKIEDIKNKNDSNIVDFLPSGERPYIAVLIDKIHLAIDGIAPGRMTPVEVLGCLDLVSKKFYMEQFEED